VLNRPLPTSIKEMWEKVEDGAHCAVEGSLHQGGPCEGALMVVHAEENYAEAQVADGIYFCMRRDAIERLVAENESAMKFFVGYAGWTAGQLDAEMSEGSWLTAPATPQMVFEGDEHLWTDLIRAISKSTVTALVDPKLIPDDPSVN
jgi:putative transcriptional regulator